MTVIVQLLNYAATHHDATIRYQASNMILHIDSDASYLSLPKARSQAGGFYYLSAKSHNPSQPPNSKPPLNDRVRILCNQLRNDMALAAEAEVGTLFSNEKEAVALGNTLKDIGHLQSPTAIKTDNFTTCGISNNTIK